MLKQKSVTSSVVMCGLALVALLSGCGKEEFVKKDYLESASAVGFRRIPPKVDIALVVDNTGSMRTAVTEVDQALKTFVSSIQNKFWDYHVGKIQFYGSTQSNSLNQILVNSAYNSATLPDGSPNHGVIVTGNYPYTGQSYAVTDPNSFSLLSGVDFNTNSTTDYALSAMHNRIVTSMNDTRELFVRPDAPLVYIVVTNGAAAELLINSNDPESGYNSTNITNWAATLRSAKLGHPINQVRFYPIASVSRKTEAQCSLGAGSGTSYSGSGYFQIAGILNAPYTLSTTTTDICRINPSDSANTYVNSVLDAIGRNLEESIDSYVTSRLVRPTAFNPRAVYKNGVALTKDDTVNGWRYVGYQSNKPLITAIRDDDGNDTDYFTNYQSGYMIELYGDARMVGSDVPSIDLQQ